MKEKIFNKNNSMLLIISVLFLSLIFNVYTYMENYKYKQMMGENAYNKVEEIRYRNESVLNVLKEGIESKTLAHEQLLMLYKNCNYISDSAVQLWSDYGIEGQNDIISTKVSTLTTESVNNDVYLRIQNLIFEYLNMEMKNGIDKLILDEKMLMNFEKIQAMAKDIQNYYKDFNNKNLNNLSEESRKGKIIKEHYWIDIIKGINEVVQPYINYPFIVEQ